MSATGMGIVGVRIDGRVPGPMLPASPDPAHHDSLDERIGRGRGTIDAQAHAHPVLGALGAVAGFAAGAAVARALGGGLRGMAGGAIVGLALETAAFAGVALLRGPTPLHGATGAQPALDPAGTGPTGSSPTEPHHLRVMTYNLRGMVGGTGDGHRMVELQQVADVVNRYHPDVLVLQEVYDDEQGYGQGVDELQALTGALHPNSVAAGTAYVRRNGSNDVNAVMTFHGYGISDARGLRMPHTGIASRGATDTMVVAPDGTSLRVAGTHLSFDGGFDAEVDALGADLRATGVQSSNVPTIVAGDFNAQSETRRGKHQAAVLQPLGFVEAQQAMHTVTRATTTFPTSPGDDIDRIYSTHLTPVAAQVALDARGVSDHVPVVADYEFQG